MPCLSLFEILVTASLATITESGSRIIGKNFTLSCISTVWSERREDPVIMWTGPQGSIDLMSNPIGIGLQMTNMSNSTFIATLKFVPLQARHKGNYTCNVDFEGSHKSATLHVNVAGNFTLKFIQESKLQFFLHYIVPEIEVVLSVTHQPVVAQSYNLKCEINGAENLNPTFSFHWIKNNGTESPVKVNISTIFFPVFKLSDTGNFTCKVNVSSDYLDNVITANDVAHLRTQSKLDHLKYFTHNYSSVTVPDPVSVFIESVDTYGRPIFLPSRIVTNVTLTCTVILSPKVDVPVRVRTQWNGPDEFNAAHMAMISTNMHSSVITISFLNIHKAGRYGCTVTVTPSPANSIFITGEGIQNNDTTVVLCKVNIVISQSCYYPCHTLKLKDKAHIEKNKVSYIVGDDVNLYCNVTIGGMIKEPQLVASWSREKGHHNSTLHINPLRATDALTYTCHVFFGQTIKNESIDVYATCKPKNIIDHNDKSRVLYYILMIL